MEHAVPDELHTILIKAKEIGAQLASISQDNAIAVMINGGSHGEVARQGIEFMSKENPITVMTNSGCKASYNIGQIRGIVGQHFYRGERLKPVLTTRILPTFHE